MNGYIVSYILISNRTFSLTTKGNIVSIMIFKSIRNKFINRVMKKPSNPNEGWIIFFDDSNGDRHYFQKIYSIGRCKFTTSIHFAMFDDLMSCNEMLTKIQESLKLYDGIPCYPLKTIKLMVAMATVTKKK